MNFLDDGDFGGGGSRGEARTFANDPPGRRYLGDSRGLVAQLQGDGSCLGLNGFSPRAAGSKMAPGSSWRRRCFIILSSCSAVGRRGLFSGTTSGSGSPLLDVAELRGCFFLSHMMVC